MAAAQAQIQLMEPGSVDAPHLSLMERGEAEMSHRDWDGAISDFTEALGFNMNNMTAYFKRGQCFFYQKKYVEALSDFEYMLKASPKDTQALLWSGTAEAKMGQEEKALDFYLRAMRCDPQLVVQFQKGQAQGGVKDQKVNPKNEGAVSAYEKAVAKYVSEHPELNLGAGATGADAAASAAKSPHGSVSNGNAGNNSTVESGDTASKSKP
jgi:tetratricopeptide (TPR) repeat protein